MAEIQASDTPERMIAAVERGETVIIKRGDRAIARVVPEAPRTEAESAGAFQALDDLRKGKRGIIDATIDEVLKWRHEGHKY